MLDSPGLPTRDRSTAQPPPPVILPACAGGRRGARGARGSLRSSTWRRRRARVVERICVLLLPLAWSRVARGEDPPAEVVVTGTRTPESAQRAAVRVDVVTRDEAERRGATSVGEALASQPGVVVNPSAYASLGGVSAVQIQGFDRARVLVLEDGERIIGDTGGAIDLAMLPLAGVARVEVVAGPMSALYGASAIGGVVNVISAPPAELGASGAARLEGRSYRGLYGAGGAAYRWSSAWIALEGSGLRQDGVPSSEPSPTLVVPEVRRASVGVRGGATLDDRTEVRARVRLLHDETHGTQAQSVPGLGTYAVDAPATANRWAALATTEHRFARGGSLRVTMGHQQFWSEAATRFRDSPQETSHLGHDRLESVEAVGTVADGPRTWVLGGRGEVELFSQDVETVTATPTGVAASASPEVEPIMLSTAAVYGQLSWKLGRFTVLPGVRQEAHLRYGGSTTPRLAVAWRPIDDLTLRAAAGSGFRTPSAKELGFVFDHSVYGYRVVGNPSLEPERSRGVTADVAFRPDPIVLLRASGFANWVEQLIDIDTGAGVTADGVTTYAYRNFGRARTAGGQLGVVVEPSKRVRAEAAYDYLWTWDALAREPLAARPPHAVTAALRVTLPLDLVAYTRARWSSDAFVARDAPRAPAWTNLDARLSHALFPRSEAYVGVLNALDVRQVPGRIGDLRPAMGRVVYVGVRAEFPAEEEP